MKVHESHDLSSSVSLSATFTVLAYHWRLRLDEQNRAIFSLFTWQIFTFSEEKKKMCLGLCDLFPPHLHGAHIDTWNHQVSIFLFMVFHIDSFIKLANFGLLHL